MAAICCVGGSAAAAAAGVTAAAWGWGCVCVFGAPRARPLPGGAAVGPVWPGLLAGSVGCVAGAPLARPRALPLPDIMTFLVESDKLSCSEARFVLRCACVDYSGSLGIHALAGRALL